MSEKTTMEIERRNPEYKEFRFTVMEAQPVVEMIHLLSQVMESYKDVSKGGIDSVAHWFYKSYSKENIED